MISLQNHVHEQNYLIVYVRERMWLKKKRRFEKLGKAAASLTEAFLIIEKVLDEAQ